jgi:flagellar hook-basal body protein
VGHFFYANGETYYVSDVEYSATTTITTITLDNSNGLAAADTLANMTFNVSNLTTLGYTASTSSAVGTTVASTLNLPKGQKVDNKYQGMAITETMTDNEAGRAGSIFTGGDATMRIVAATEDGTASEFTYIDADGDGELSEKVYRVGHDGTDLFIDFDGDDSGAAAVQSTGDGTIATSQLESLSAYADDEKVYTDASGNVYRKVPKIYDSSETSVYLDDHNKGVYDEVRYGIAKSIDTTGDGAGDTILDRDGDGAADLYVVDENGDGLVSAGENIVISTQTDTSGDLTTVTDVSSSDTATLERADASIINGDSSGSGRIQIRGNIGTENEISGISFISGTNVVERTIFASSALADADGHGYSIESTANGESVSQNIVVYDSLGKSHDVNMTFVLETKDNDTATWRWFAESPDVTQSEGIFPVGDPRGVSPSVNVGSGTVKFDNFGRYLSSTGATTNSEAMLHIPLEGSNTDSALAIKPDFSILTAFASSTGSEVDVREQDGFAQGVMDRFTVNADGTVTGIYTNGMTEVVAQVALAAFANPDGLTRSGGNLFTVGSNSGNAMIGEAGTGERGAIRGEALELSNVDITDEFTKMIVAQRSYQANARVVTKSDELLQELMQIIR